LGSAEDLFMSLVFFLSDAGALSESG